MYVWLRGSSSGTLVRLLGPSPSREGEKWSNRELLEFLRERGMRLEVAGTFPGFGRNAGGRMVLIEEGNATLEAWQLNFVALTHFNPLDRNQPLPDGVVTVFQSDSLESAKAEVNYWVNEMLLPKDRFFTWGRFVFYGDPATIAELRKALR
jgi:hypothetical protein